MLALRALVPFPVQADFAPAARESPYRHGQRSMNMGGVDLRLKFAGDSLGSSTNSPGVLLPDAPPFETDGHLVAKLDTEKSSVFDYQDFNGRIGDSDIHGTLTYTTRQTASRNWKDVVPPAESLPIWAL